MAEVLGTVASGAGIFALAVQLGDSIKKLNEFWNNYKDCPDDIRRTTSELEVLKLVIEDISENYGSQQNLTVRVGSLVGKAILQCESATKELKMLVDEFGRMSLVGKKRAALRMAFKRGEWDKFRARLEGAKLSLILAHQCYYQTVIHRHLAFHGQLLEQMNMTLQASILENPSNHDEPVSLKNSDDRSIINPYASRSEVQVPKRQKEGNSEIYSTIVERGTSGNYSNSFTRGLLGFIRYQQNSTKRSVHSGSGEQKYSSTEEELRITLQLPTWFFSWQYDVQIRKSQRGWDYRLRSCNIVPKDAPVFRYCLEGNIQALKTLFESGYASPFDSNADGITALHYATSGVQAAVCSLLLDYGADVHALTIQRPKIRPQDERVLHDDGRAVKISSISGNPISSIMKYGQLYDKADLGPSFEATIRVLVEKGQYDLSTSNFIGFASPDGNDKYMGPTSLFRWLQSQLLTPLTDLDHDFERSMEVILLYCDQAWDNCAEIVQEMLPNGRPDQRMSSYQGSNRRTILSILTATWTYRGFWNQREEFERFEGLIRDCIVAGANLHVVFEEEGIITSLVLQLIRHALEYSKYRPSVSDLRVLKYFLKPWLRLLSECQISLVSFWEEEIELYYSGQVSWLLRSMYSGEFDFQILRIDYGDIPEDFDVVFEDSYITNDLLVPFWGSVEGNIWEDSRRVSEMPGSWDSDSNS